MIDFDEYLHQSEPDKRAKSYAWQTAIGLQAVDGLKTSDYLLDTVRKDIEGEIDIDEVSRLIHSYYETKGIHTEEDEEQHEADKASVNIRRLLTEQTFAFTLVGLTSIHRRIFDGIFKFAGQIRDYNISKREWVLRGESVLYVSAPDIRRAIEYDLEQERQFDYSGVNPEGFIRHFARFIAGLWQIHPFGEGNTRTTAVFAIKYLRSMGFHIENDLFANHAWYFRNALVRANYQNIQKGITANREYLERFLRNLLMGEQNELRNRYLLVNAPEKLPDPTSNPTSYPTSNPTSNDSHWNIPNENVHRLIEVLDRQQLSVKSMLAALGLKNRESFIDTYLTPAMQEGVVAMLYPDKPKHPRQKYLLTAKGLALLTEKTKG